MATDFERLRDLLPRLERFAEEVEGAKRREVRRSSFEDLCFRYSDLARETGTLLGRAFPVREARREDFGISGGIVRLDALKDLAGLAADLLEAAKRTAEGRVIIPGVLPCPKGGGEPCHKHGEIDPRRFDVFFALPFVDPPTCKKTCDVLIDWLVEKRGIDQMRIFRADKWTYSGDFICKICKALQESRLVVADITGGNPNVFYEIGLAVGMGKPVVLIYDNTAPGGRIPSDLLAWEYIPYEGDNPDDPDWLEHFGVVFDGTLARRS